MKEAGSAYVNQDVNRAIQQPPEFVTGMLVAGEKWKQPAETVTFTVVGSGGGVGPKDTPDGLPVGGAKGGTSKFGSWFGGSCQPKGLKFDDTKTRWSLFDFGFLGAVAATLNYGRLKYTQTLPDGTVQDGSANWKLVDNRKERYFNAAMRHLVAWYSGEKLDAESGQHHLAHCACCLMFLFWDDNKAE